MGASASIKGDLLRAAVATLAVEGGGVVPSRIEKRDEFLIRDDLGVVGQLHRLRVARLPAADLLVSRLVHFPWQVGGDDGQGQAKERRKGMFSDLVLVRRRLTASARRG